MKLFYKNFLNGRLAITWVNAHYMVADVISVTESTEGITIWYKALIEVE